MKILLILAVLLVAQARGNFFSNLGHKFHDQLNNIAHSISDIFAAKAAQLLKDMKASGANLLSEGIQVLAINAANGLNKNKQPNDETRALSIPPALQKMETDLHEVLETLTSEMKNIVKFTVDSFRGVVDKVSKLEINPEQAVKEIDAFVGTHNFLADTFLQTLISKAKDVASSFMSHKRSNAGDFMTSIIGKLHDLLKPMVDGLKMMVSTTGESLKNSLSQTAGQTLHQLLAGLANTN